ncbi:MAG: TVP38/TMEM64 family protein, partial [Smithellaceae bacterium]
MGFIDTSNNRQLIFKAILLVALLSLSTYLFIHYDLYLFFTSKRKIIEFIRVSPFDEIVFIFLQVVQVVAAPIPGELTGFIGGYLYGPVLGTVYSTFGLTLGSWLDFVLANFFGMPLLEKIIKPAV